jgi:sugar/nucleoside kinase (ribokinase family)
LALIGEKERLFDLLVIGEINPDLIVRGPDVTPVFGQVEKLVEGAELVIGSSSVITACGAARLGLKVAFTGLVGGDEFGRFMLEAMRQAGIDVSGCVVDKAAATGLSVILSAPDDRAILTYPGAIPLLRREQVDEARFSLARHLHIGSYFLLDALRPDMPALLASAKEQGLTVSLDTNWDPTGGWDLTAVLPLLDLLFPNKNEVRQISGKEDFAAGVEVLAGQVPTLAVKLGPQGGLARQGGRSVTAPALQVDVVDTTGAGDSFNAGFLYGYLNGHDLQDALDLACACGSLSTRAAGGTAAQPTLGEARAALRVKR